MTRLEFLEQLNSGISSLPQNEVNERLMFYSEMIDDLIEEGLSEEEAVSKIGPVDEIISQITSELPISEVIKKKIAPTRRLRAWEIVLLILGSPLWISLLIAAFAVALSLYASIWAVIISLWACFASLIGCTLGALVGCIVFICNGNSLSGVAMLGIALACAGFSILLFFGCREVSNGIVMLTKRLFRRKKEVA